MSGYHSTNECNETDVVIYARLHGMHLENAVTLMQYLVLLATIRDEKFQSKLFYREKGQKM